MIGITDYRCEECLRLIIIKHLRNELKTTNARVEELEAEIRDMKSFIVKLRGKVDPNDWLGMDNLVAENAVLKAKLMEEKDG